MRLALSMPRWDGSSRQARRPHHPETTELQELQSALHPPHPYPYPSTPSPTPTILRNTCNNSGWKGTRVRAQVVGEYTTWPGPNGSRLSEIAADRYGSRLDGMLKIKGNLSNKIYRFENIYELPKSFPSPPKLVRSTKVVTFSSIMIREKKPSLKNGGGQKSNS